MFTEISWSNYITIVVIFLAAYYLFVGYRYFRNDLLELLSGKKIHATDKANFNASLQKIKNENIEEAVKKPHDFQIAQAASDEIQAFLREASGNQLNEDEVMNGLRRLLSKYPDLKESSFSDLIENLIINECELNLSIQLDTAQAKCLWV